MEFASWTVLWLAGHEQCVLCASLCVFCLGVCHMPLLFYPVCDIDVYPPRAERGASPNCGWLYTEMAQEGKKKPLKMEFGNPFWCVTDTSCTPALLSGSLLFVHKEQMFSYLKGPEKEAGCL